MRSHAVSEHYAHSTLIGAISDGLRKLGKPESSVTLEDLAPIDEFHIGGRQATRELMQKLAPSPCDHFLDVGSGLGGAARFVASEYDCQVVGVDLTEDYVRTANTLSAWTGLSARVSFIHGDALALPFGDNEFTVGSMLHVGMNIRDKLALFQELARVLTSGSLLGIYDVMQNRVANLNYPLPWATSPECNHVASREDYLAALAQAGFEIVAVRSCGPQALAYFSRLRSVTANKDDNQALGLHILMGKRRTQQVANMYANLSSGSLEPYELVGRLR